MFIQENDFENVVCKMAAILWWSYCVMAVLATALYVSIGNKTVPMTRQFHCRV